MSENQHAHADSLTVLHAPCHGPTLRTKQIDHALSFEACSTGFSEGYRRTVYFITRPKYSTTVGRKMVPVRFLRGPHDTPILRRRHHRKVESFSYKACDPSEPIKLAPDRWNMGVAYEHPFGIVGHVTAHPNAAIVNASPKVDRVLKYIEQMGKLESSIRDWQAKGYLIVVTGDMNYPENGPRWAPEATFERLNLRTWRVGVDWIAYDQRLWLSAEDRRIIPDTGQDHPWMKARFRLNRTTGLGGWPGE